MLTAVVYCLKIEKYLEVTHKNLLKQRISYGGNIFREPPKKNQPENINTVYILNVNSDHT